MKTLIFDVWGEFAHFKVFWATSSPVSFSIIPPPTALGLIGAILGLEKENNEYLKILNTAETKVGIKINNPIKKMRMGLNYINTKDGYWILIKKGKHSPRTRIWIEFLRNASFRFYVAMKDDELLNELAKNVENHFNVYTVSLGLSELLADFKFVDFSEAKEMKSENFVEIHSAVCSDIISSGNIEITDGLFLKKERLPISMNEERIVSSYKDVVFDNNCKPLLLKLDKYYSVNEQNFVFLND